MSFIDAAGRPTTLSTVALAGQRRTSLVLLALIAVMASGAAWAGLTSLDRPSCVTCHAASPAVPAGHSGPCGSLSPLPCCDQLFSLTSAHVADYPAVTFALISSVAHLLPPTSQVLAVVLAPARAAPSTASHTILRL
jgi:hypothetical protein